MPRFDVTIAGELNLDLILYGLPEQLLPERELLADRMMLTLGSSSAIVAHNLAALGSRVGFQSRIGDDPLGQHRSRASRARRSRCVARAPSRRRNHNWTHGDPASRSMAQHPHLSGNDRRNILGGSRPRLPRGLAPLSSFFLLFAAGLASAGRRAFQQAEIERTHHLPRHQRRSRRPVGRWTAGGSALRGCFPAQ